MVPEERQNSTQNETTHLRFLIAGNHLTAAGSTVQHVFAHPPYVSTCSDAPLDLGGSAMKASLTLRDDAAPLLRAKLPVELLSVPAVAALTAGDPADLRLSLATAAPALPSLRVCYAPNRPTGFSPLSLSLVLGSGPGGCPSSSAITMAVEVTAAGTLSFSLALKPSLGDFAVRKRFASAAPPQTGSPSASALASEVTMRSAVPVRGGAAAVSVRWGVRIPAEVTAGGEAGAAGVALRRMPFLVLGKVTVERRVMAQPPPLPERSQEEAMEKVRRENEKLRREVDELRAMAATGRREKDGAATSVAALADAAVTD